MLRFVASNHTTNGISLFNTAFLLKTKVEPAETCVHRKRGENVTFVIKRPGNVRKTNIDCLMLPL